MRPGAAHVYILYCFSDPYIYTKVGVASDVRARVSTLQTGNPLEIELFEAIPVESKAEALRVEKKAHDLLAQFRVNREWFDCGNDLAWLAVQVAVGKRSGLELRDKIQRITRVAA